ncbi:hypothetical protein Scep_009865 [Stephania cephalantha]|uniref:Germin-like protein n=1 Tax=Stephania cephalantha TaxID=152367 RepID=A0AAP0PEP8_9MAGN
MQMTRITLFGRKKISSISDRHIGKYRIHRHSWSGHIENPAFVSVASVNGFPCKDAVVVLPNDFFFSGLHLPGNTSKQLGSKVTPVNVAQISGLNTLAISIARLDFASGGVNPPHTHPRATEILVILEGSLHVGFVTSNPGNRLIIRVLNQGDVFVFPVGLVHFQRNVGSSNAVAIAALSSQNPGVITIANAVFGTPNQLIPSEVLTKAFQWTRMLLNFSKRSSSTL